ncbi:carboxypeptidase-like regulatory domain-containing protein, partial [Arthrospira platensis SPKY1]|nr:carboxypeptidase-like regulatory domain-containing protein [Arthrospira platensis SPKY1]
MKNGLLLIAAFFIMNSAYSQTPNNITIKGLAADTLDEPLSFSTVMLLSPKDSTLLNFTSANNDGEFRFSNIKNSDYLLKISHMNYMPYQKFMARSETAIIDLGTIK